MTESQSVREESCDVLIVGAGMSGLFAASRLLEHNPKLSVVVVEKLGYVGGRLETTHVKIKGDDGELYPVKDEEGGMRFVPKGTGMANLWALLDAYQIATVPFVMGGDNNRMYARGTSFTRQHEPLIWSLLYRLAPAERNLNATSLLAQVMQAVLDQNPGGHKAGSWPDTPQTWIEFRNTFVYDGVPINQWGFWAMMRAHGLTEEAITMIGHAIGFMGPINAAVNAGESLQIIFDFPAAATFFTARDGYQSLPLAIAADVTRRGGSIHLGEQVRDVALDGDDKIVHTDKATYRAARVVLAIPREALTRIAAQSTVLQRPELTAAADSVRDMELTKVGLFFKSRWWNNDPTLLVPPAGTGSDTPAPIGMLNGPAFSDLPAGSVYCFSQYPEDPTKDATYGGPAALTIYTDFDRGNFWREMQNLGEKYQTPEFPRPPPNTYAASTALVEEAMRQITAIFGLPAGAPVPMPVLSTYRVWGQGKFGHGYHQYKLNVDDREVYQAIWHPAPGVFICNEAWSPEQGWVEGSLIATDNVLVNGFGLAPFVPPSAASGSGES